MEAEFQDSSNDNVKIITISNIILPLFILTEKPRIIKTESYYGICLNHDYLGLYDYPDYLT